jgi:hypothetical protein
MAVTGSVGAMLVGWTVSAELGLYQNSPQVYYCGHMTHMHNPVLFNQVAEVIRVRLAVIEKAEVSWVVIYNWWLSNGGRVVQPD